MGTVNDEILRATGGPTIPDGLRSFYIARGGAPVAAVVAAGGSLGDIERAFLNAIGAPYGPVNDMWMQALGVYGITGNSNDADYQYWSQVPSGGALWNAGLLPSPPSMWYNETSAITLNGSNISAWNDLSPNGFNLTQSVAGQQPARILSGLNGMRTIRGDGVDDVLVANFAGAKALYQNANSCWCAMMYKRITGSALIRELFSVSNNVTGTSRFYLCSDNTGVAGQINLRVRRLDADSVAILTGPTILDTNFHIIFASVDYQNRTGEIWIDGSLAAQNATLTTAGATSNTASADAPCYFANPTGGASNTEASEAMNGLIIPTGLNRQKIEGILAYKGGIQSVLPANHPYKIVPP